jgi:hypothetical protein
MILNTSRLRSHPGRLGFAMLGRRWGVKQRHRLTPQRVFWHPCGRASGMVERRVKDGDDNSLTSEPEMIQVYRDTWELEVHSYLTYLRDRFNVVHELLADSGSVFVQIGEENVHRVRAVLDDVFGGR